MTTGDNIRKARKNAGLTQQQLAKKLDITQSAIAKFENDKTNIKYSTLQKFATALGVDVLSLLDGNKKTFNSLIDTDLIEIYHIDILKAIFQTAYPASTLKYSIENDRYTIQWIDAYKDEHRATLTSDDVVALIDDILDYFDFKLQQHEY